MDLDDETLERFATQMQETYNEESILHDLVSVVRYDPAEHQSLTYMQIGKRIWLPFDFITTTIEVTNARRLLRAITGGEKRFVLDHLSDIPVDQLQTPDSNEGFSVASMRSAAAQIRDPDYAFVPNTKRYNMQLREWEDMDQISYEDGETLDIDGGVRLRWVPEDWGYEDIYLVSRDGVEVVQKQFEDAPIPKGVESNSEYHSLSANQRLMLYFGEVKEMEEEESFERKVDFLYRVILSKPRFSPRSVCRIPPPE